MATYTTHYNLKKPALADKIRIADFNGNADTIDATMYENATLGAQLKSAIGIVENTNTATHNISEGNFVIWKGVLKVASSAISTGATLSDANLSSVPNGGLNALNSKIQSKEFTPGSNDSLLTWLLANTNRNNLPFSFVKIGNNQMSDTPSAIGVSEFSGTCQGNGDRLTVELVRYANNNNNKFVRTIYQNNWYGNWQEISINSNLHSLASENNNVVVNNGGYVQFGSTVIVCAKVTLSASVGESTKILSGFPSTTDGFALPMIGVNKAYSIRMSGSNAYTDQSTSSGEYWITGAYLVY